jgi:hypothetical protein
MNDAAVSGATLLLLREIISAWASRNERRAAKDAGRLAFWRDGMLQQIEAIANGKHRREVVRELRKAFDESGGRVEEALNRPREVRSKIGPNAIGKQVDLVINHAEYGKTGIRGDIELLLHQLESPAEPQYRDTVEEAAKADARYLIGRIEAFNAEVGKLQRLVQAVSSK